MRWALALVVMAACTDDVTFGQVQAIEDGSGMLQMRACLDAELFSCDGQDVILTATHDDASAALKFSGVFFPEHVGVLPLGSRKTKIVVADGDARAVMTLPTSFAVVTDASGPLHAADTIQLSWGAAGEPLVWQANATCATTPTYPSTGIETIEDDGALTVTVASLEKRMERSLAGCDVDIELSRVREGSVDDGFRAESATGIVRRTARVTIE